MSAGPAVAMSRPVPPPPPLPPLPPLPPVPSPCHVRREDGRVVDLRVVIRATKAKERSRRRVKRERASATCDSSLRRRARPASFDPYMCDMQPRIPASDCMTWGISPCHTSPHACGQRRRRVSWPEPAPPRTATSRLQVTARFCCGTRARNCAIKARCGEHFSSRLRSRSPVTAARSTRSCRRRRPRRRPTSPPSGPTRRSTSPNHFLASIEMQISGEPFAQLLGRNLAGYDRFSATTDLYIDPATGRADRRSAQLLDRRRVVRVLQAADEQHLVRVGRRAVAAVRPRAQPAAARPATRPSRSCVDRVQHVRRRRRTPAARRAPTGSSRRRPPTTRSTSTAGPASGRCSPSSSRSTRHRARRRAATAAAAVAGGYAGGAPARRSWATTSAATTRSTCRTATARSTRCSSPRRSASPRGSRGCGSSTTGSRCTTRPATRITQVADADLPQVGQPGNNVVGKYPDPNDPTGQALVDGIAGVYLGDIALEGFQGLTMIDEMDNKAALLLEQLLTSDGETLGGFASTKDGARLRLHLAAALVAGADRGDRDARSGAAAGQLVALLPAADRASRSPTAPASCAASPRSPAASPSSSRSPTSTTPTSAAQARARATFDGDPFPADNQLARRRGVARTIARSAVIKVALVDIDRLHFDAAHQVLVDRRASRGAVVSAAPSSPPSTPPTPSSACARRCARSRRRWRSTPTTRPTRTAAPTALDGAKLGGAPAPLPRAHRCSSSRAEADFLADKLIDADGAVANSYDSPPATRDLTPTRIESEAAAIRGLLDAYLATSERALSPGGDARLRRSRAPLLDDRRARLPHRRRRERPHRLDAARASARCRARCASTGSWWRAARATSASPPSCSSACKRTNKLVPTAGTTPTATTSCSTRPSAPAPACRWASARSPASWRAPEDAATATATASSRSRRCSCRRRSAPSSCYSAVAELARRATEDAEA